MGEMAVEMKGDWVLRASLQPPNRMTSSHPTSAVVCFLACDSVYEDFQRRRWTLLKEMFAIDNQQTPNIFSSMGQILLDGEFAWPRAQTSTRRAL